LPGHFRFGLDCGARQSLRVSDNPDPRSEEARAPVFPAYGCDRTILFQAEFQGALPFSWNPFPDTWEGSGLGGLFELRPVWALFFNAGQGWARGSLGNGVSRTDSPTRADLGFGVFAGPIGLYWAYPLNRGDRGMNFFVRLERRF
jgi:hypothetical protein